MHPTARQTKRQRELHPNRPTPVSKRSSIPSTTVSESRSQPAGHHAPTCDSGCDLESLPVGVAASTAPQDLEVLSVRVDVTMAACDLESLSLPATPSAKPNITSRKGLKYVKKPSPAEMKVATTLYLKRELTMSQVAWLTDINLSTLATRITALMKNGVHWVIPDDPMRMRVTNRIRRMRAAAEDALFFSSTDKETSKRSLRKLLPLLSKVKHTIDICNWNISYGDLVELVLAAKERGILVRVVTDSAQAGQWFAKVQELKAANIPVHLLGTTNWCMHHKFCILDGVTPLNGSFNWSDRAAKRNMENIIVMSSLKLVRLFKREFARIVRLDHNLAAFYAEQKKSKAEQTDKVEVEAEIETEAEVEIVAVEEEATEKAAVAEDAAAAVDLSATSASVSRESCVAQQVGALFCVGKLLKARLQRFLHGDLGVVEQIYFRRQAQLHHEVVVQEAAKAPDRLVQDLEVLKRDVEKRVLAHKLGDDLARVDLAVVASTHLIGEFAMDSTPPAPPPLTAPTTPLAPTRHTPVNISWNDR